MQVNKSLPRISVIMAVHNGEKYIREALDSILNQTFRDFEFIIIDDGSTDRSKPILEEYSIKDNRIRLISRENRGLTKSLNEGLALARGEFIARMDADDVALPSRLAKQVDFLEVNPTISVVGARAEIIDEDGDAIKIWDVPGDHDSIDSRHLIGLGGQIIHPAALMRTSKVIEVGYYDESFKTAQDLDLWLRLAENSSLANLPDILIRYRLTNSGITLSKSAQQENDVELAVQNARTRRGVPLLKAGSLKGQLPLAFEERSQLWATWAINSGNYKTARKHTRRLVLNQRPSLPSVKLFVVAHLGTYGKSIGRLKNSLLRCILLGNHLKTHKG